jgi:SpoIID/LytB domain protein
MRRLWVTAIVTAAIASILSGCTLTRNNEGLRAREYRKEPTISLFINETGQKKDIALEDYITGVVAGEMLPDWPLQAYEAQAIVARTFTLELLKRTGGTQKLHGTDMSTDEKETQAYNESAITPVIKKAVRNTRGEVITYRGKYIRSWFHAASGGRTARAKEGLNIKEAEPRYTASVRVSEPSAPPESKVWTATIPLTEVAAALGKAIPDVGTIQSIKILSRGQSGRVTKFLITSDKVTVLPAVLLIFVYLRMQKGTEQQLRKSNYFINGANILYALINLSHLVWFAILALLIARL